MERFAREDVSQGEVPREVKVDFEDVSVEARIEAGGVFAEGVTFEVDDLGFIREMEVVSSMA